MKNFKLIFSVLVLTFTLTTSSAQFPIGKDITTAESLAKSFFKANLCSLIRTERDEHGVDLLFKQEFTYRLVKNKYNNVETISIHCNAATLPFLLKILKYNDWYGGSLDKQVINPGYPVELTKEYKFYFHNGYMIQYNDWYIPEEAEIIITKMKT